MDSAVIKTCADLLYNAEHSCRAVEPLTGMYLGLTVDDAYRIQLANVERVVEEGHRVSGKKIGLTSPGIQKQMGVDEPDYGHLFAAMDCADGETKTDTMILPKIEAELAFVLKKDLTGGAVTPQDVRDATDYVVGAFEVVDSRIADWRIKLADTISDNASSGRYILGREKVQVGDMDLAAIGMTFYKNGDQIDAGSGAAVLGDPCMAVAWLSNRLYRYGVALKAGEVILSGAFTAAPPAQKGDIFEARFTAPFGTVEARFI